LTQLNDNINQYGGNYEIWRQGIKNQLKHSTHEIFAICLFDCVFNICLSATCWRIKDYQDKSPLPQIDLREALRHANGVVNNGGRSV